MIKNSQKDGGIPSSAKIIKIAPITVKVLCTDILISLEVLLDTAPPIDIYTPALILKNEIERIVYASDQHDYSPSAFEHRP